MNDYVSTGEAILSSMSKWDMLDDLVSRRDYIIGKIEALDETMDDLHFHHPATPTQIKEVDRLVKLILALDHQAVGLIKDTQAQALEDLKTNRQKEKFLDYGIKDDFAGSFVDV